MKRILILIRSFNDFDQALPIIDYIVNNSDNTVSVWSFNNNLKGCSTHIKYLESLNIPVEYLSDKISIISKYILKFYLSLTKVSLKSQQYSFLIPVTILVSNIRPVIDILLNNEYSRILKNYSFNIVMMDTGMETSNDGRSMLAASRGNDIGVVGYSHGYSVYSNSDPLQKDKLMHGKIKSFLIKMAKPLRKRVYADFYLTGVGQINAHFRHPKHMGHFEPSELHRVKEIGMPRYDRDWVNKYRVYVLHNQSFSYGDKNKLNVVLFMSHPQYNVRKDMLYLLINKLSTLDNINFVYKPHTRRGLHLINKNKLNGLDVSDISSVKLSEWADIGIVYGSSIGMQLLIDSVPLVVPSFVHSNTTIYEDDEAAISIDTIEELTDLMHKSKTEIINMIDQNKVDNFIDNVVYGNDKENMMHSYCSFSFR